MIVGLGIDVASVERVRRVLERFGDRFSARVLTEGEQSDLAPRRADRAEAFAGRFAAKEAAVKALLGRDAVGGDQGGSSPRRIETASCRFTSARAPAASPGTGR